MSWRDRKHRQCPNCKQTKPIRDFRLRTGALAEKQNRIGQPYGWCKPCESLRRGFSPLSYWQCGINNIRTRAKAKYIEFNLTPQALTKMCEDQKMRCAISNRELTFIAGKGRVHTNASVDRIQCKGPYTIENVRIVCDYANVMRGDCDDENFIEWCKDVLDTIGRQDADH